MIEPRTTSICCRADRFLDGIAQKYDEGRSHEVTSIEKFINDTETLAELRRMARVVNKQRLIRDNLKRELASNKDQGVGNDDEHEYFLERIKEYETCIRDNIEETKRIATKYHWKDEFCFLSEWNSYFFNLGEKPYSRIDIFFLVIQRIKIRSIRFLGIGIEFESEPVSFKK